MAEGILSFFKALPRILALIDRLGRAFAQTDVQEWMTKLEANIDLLEKAQSPNEKSNAALALALSIRALK